MVERNGGAKELGWMHSLFGIGTIQAVLQATVAPEFQGRVFTLQMSLGTVVAPFGLALAAPVAELLGSG